MQATCLSSQRVRKVIKDCLLTDDDDPAHAVCAEGITRMLVFHAGRLESHRQEIAAMLAELPDSFRRDNGGYTFLEIHIDRHGNQWTGLRQIMEELVCLGLATHQVEYCMPRNVWPILPGEVPYIVIK